MSIIIRRQFVNYESDEYELLGSKEVAEVKSVFESYPWKEQVEKHLELIESHAFPSLNLEHENRELVINGYGPGRFSVQFLYLQLFNKSKIIYDLTYNDILKLIEKFPVESTNQFLRTLNKFKVVKTSFTQKIFSAFGRGKKKVCSSNNSLINARYEFTTQRMIYMFCWSILYLLMPLVIHIMVGSTFDLSDFLILQGFCTLLALPGTIISINHFRRNGKLKIHFQKGDNRFIAVIGKEKYLFDKKDFSKLYRFVSNSNNSPWNGYEYSVLKFKNGSELWLSNILIKSEDLDNHISFVDMEFKKEWIPLLKKTVVSKY